MRRALGKGLSQLIGEQFESGPSEVAVDSVQPNQRQPRTHFDEGALQELAKSISEFGVIQPLIVRPLSEGQYELIAGERRLRAARLAGLTTVPVLMRSAGNQSSLEMAIVENIQREDINALEQAKAYRRLMDEFDLGQDAVAAKVGKSRSAVANTVRLLRLPNRIQEGLMEGRITEGHARALLSFENPDQQLAVYDQILERGLTVREVENAGKARPVRRPPVSAEPSAEDANLEEALSTYVGARARVVRSEAGGKLSIEFYSDDDLMRILDVLGFRL